jgi:hypothetical protein
LTIDILYASAGLQPQQVAMLQAMLAGGGLGGPAAGDDEDEEEEDDFYGDHGPFQGGPCRLQGVCLLLCFFLCFLL